MCFCEIKWGCKCQDSGNNTYSCARTLKEDENSLFCAFQDNEDFIELYDLDEDPYQLSNIVSTVSDQAVRSYMDTIQSFKK